MKRKLSNLMDETDDMLNILGEVLGGLFLLAVCSPVLAVILPCYAISWGFAMLCVLIKRAVVIGLKGNKHEKI